MAEEDMIEMLLRGSEDIYADYHAAIEEKMNGIGSELEIIQDSGIVSEELYQRFEDSLLGWGNAGYKVIEEIEAGNKETAVELIFKECVPILEEVEQVVDEIDAVTAKEQKLSIARTMFATIAGILISIVFIVVTVVISRKAGQRIIDVIMEPVYEIKDAAKELSDGNLHSHIEFYSEDELGDLAESLRESIRSLGLYIDDIARMMNGFSEGDFTVQKGNIEWKGDFAGILDSFVKFEESISGTVKGIQSIADQVDNSAQQIAESSMNLAEGATEQAGVTAQLSVTVDNVSRRILQNSLSAKEISKNENNVSAEIVNSNGKMQEMMNSMDEINHQNNSATSQECAAASQEMSGQADSLKDSIRKFTVA